MGQLDGRTAVVFGVANARSLAWSIAEALRAEGATIGLVHRRPARAARTAALARPLAPAFISACDVRDDAAIAAVFDDAARAFGGSLDIVIHSIAFAEPEDLAGRFVDTGREGFRTALEVSCYSLVAIARAASPYLTRRGSIVTLSAIGSQRVLPHYNVMGVAKAALESAVRYLAADLGPSGVRVNAISAGAVRTAAAVSVPGFRDHHRRLATLSPLRRAVDASDVANAAVWLCSDRAAGITGQIVNVDAGLSALALIDQPGEEASH